MRSTISIQPTTTLREPAELVERGLVPVEDLPALEKVAARYAIAVTPEVASLIDPDDPLDPIARQYIPSAEELAAQPNEKPDPIGDEARSPVAGIVHRYPDRVLFKLVHVCAVYCRFCFRREMVGPGKATTLSDGAYQNALAYIRAHSQVWEVILTGGDPLMLSPRRLSEVLADLARIDHVKVVRIHTRVPVAEPQRITDKMIAALKVKGATTWVALHANHVRELTQKARTVCAAMIDAGIPMVSQSVLLRGVNDDPVTLEALMRGFVECRIKPYYLHHGDLAPGTSHLRTTLAHGQEIMRALRGRARDCDLIVVAPATADLMAKMAHGTADDLASAILLASNAPILLAPAMNPLMWNNAATKRNVATLQRDGVGMIGPNAGEMAEANEAGVGRMAEPLEIAAAVEQLLRPSRPQPLAGKRILITAGPTHEPIDPVRYIANRSSGKQGYAIAAAARAAGADVTLISGPVDLEPPQGVAVIRIESARDMLREVEAALPADIAIFAAAVADWRVAREGEQKLKKTASAMPPLELVENPDILATISHLTDKRPPLVVGFAAETEHLIENAKAKLARKGCDWIVANDVSPATGVMGGDRNSVHLLSRVKGDTERIDIDSWPVMTKEEVASALVRRIADAVAAGTQS